jgi:hypothetical protein
MHRFCSRIPGPVVEALLVILQAVHRRPIVLPHIHRRIVPFPDQGGQSLRHLRRVAGSRATAV